MDITIRAMFATFSVFERRHFWLEWFKCVLTAVGIFLKYGSYITWFHFVRFCESSVSCYYQRVGILQSVVCHFKLSIF